MPDVRHKVDGRRKRTTIAAEANGRAWGERTLRAQVAKARALGGPVDTAGQDALVETAAIPERHAWMAIRWMSWVVALAVAVVLVVNAVVDPRGIVGWRIFPDVTGTGKLLREKAFRLEKLDRAPEILVLGSSRARPLDPRRIEQASGRSAFNGSISGGRISHAAALVGYAEELYGDDLPDLIWLLDVEAFREGLVDPEILGDERFARQFSRWDLSRSRIAGFAQLADVNMLAESRFAVARWRWGRRLPDTRTPWWETRRGTPANFRADGFVARPPAAGKRVEVHLGPQVNRLAATVYDDGFRRLTSTSRTYVRRTIEAAERRDSKVTMVLTPMHPEAQRRLAQTTYPARLRQVREFVEKTGRNSPAARVVDLTDISSFDGDPAAFDDGVHLKPANAIKLIRELDRRGALG